ncbi:MAG: hypothetical protein A3F70_08695 [Acidobacteria bacterium RIFCSPLOWO2_12_FULL_67_14]|nr:MAG: hypothetical protein A3H29_10955 [Acidobacteria bacterium RIFCSPLOWO2_02_FULL_67_21]OFW41602.1 MAG: hypothetical protein A3F70_08695 [Acidobacteria bacterium RIFCSPLOWO2_12_FULL_67_14]
MPSRAYVGLVVILSVASQLGIAAFAAASPDERPGTTVRYHVERLADTARDLSARFTAAQRSILEKLNRADLVHLPRLARLVVPSAWHEDDLTYSPFPVRYPAATRLSKLLVVDQPSQAFAAYEEGRLVLWGPVSSGGRVSPSPDGLFHLNWRSRGRHSTVNPEWYMQWYFNFDNVRGLALHAQALPGYPASHACIRLLERDANWVHGWGTGWTLGGNGRIAEPGTHLLIVGQYAFAAPPPWQSPEHLALGVELPDFSLPK